MKIKLLLTIVLCIVLLTGCTSEQQFLPLDPSPPLDIEKKTATSSTKEVDKRFFAGKWKSEEFSVNGRDNIVFISIEYKNSNAAPHLSFNFNTTAFYTPAVVEVQDSALYFTHNDEDHKAEYYLTLKNDDLIQCEFSAKNCFGMTGTYEKVLEFTRLSYVPPNLRKQV